MSERKKIIDHANLGVTTALICMDDLVKLHMDGEMSREEFWLEYMKAGRIVRLFIRQIRSGYDDWSIRWKELEEDGCLSERDREWFGEQIKKAYANG